MESKPQIKFSLLEKMEFYDDREMRLFCKVYPKIRMENLHKYIQLSIKDLCRTNEDTEESADYSTEALAIRKLMEVLHRESLHCDRDEILEYLTSLSMQPAECNEIASLVLSRDVFSGIPKCIRLRPTIKSMHWMLDISYSQRSSEETPQSQVASKLGSKLRIILLISLSDGRKHSMYLKCGRESWLRYVVRMASGGLARVDACSLQNIRKDGEENE